MTTNVKWTERHPVQVWQETANAGQNCLNVDGEFCSYLNPTPLRVQPRSALALEATPVRRNQSVSQDGQPFSPTRPQCGLGGCQPSSPGRCVGAAVRGHVVCEQPAAIPPPPPPSPPARSSPGCPAGPPRRSCSCTESACPCAGARWRPARRARPGRPACRSNRR